MLSFPVLGMIPTGRRRAAGGPSGGALLGCRFYRLAGWRRRRQGADELGGMIGDVLFQVFNPGSAFVPPFGVHF